MVELSDTQKLIIEATGHLLVTGGPGSGKTTVSILKASKFAAEELRPGQRVLFLSFARATVSRVIEAIQEDIGISREARKLIEVDTYHSFFWRIIRAHGYLIGLPRRLDLLTPSNEAIALSAVRSGYKASAKLSDEEKAQKRGSEAAERQRLALEKGRVCFSLFATYAGVILHGSRKIGGLVSNAYPIIILDEFQDTSADQWHVVRALGKTSRLIALADPEQRIFDFIGADPARLDHFKEDFSPACFDLSTDNHRSKGTDITNFGNDILKGSFGATEYNGVHFVPFEPYVNPALTTLASQTLQARKRVIKAGKRKWTVAILVPTKRMTRQVSDSFRSPMAGLPKIPHTASVDMEGAILAAELIAFLMQKGAAITNVEEFMELVCGYFRGKGGDDPSQTNIAAAAAIHAAFTKWSALESAGKATPKKSIFRATSEVYAQVLALHFTGDPDKDWVAVRGVLENGACARLREIAAEARNIRLLERGTQLRSALSLDWRTYGDYRNALEIIRQAFVQEHFALAHKPETGVIVMNMHKAKGKQFDEVIIFEGWPRWVMGKLVSNPDRIVRTNTRSSDMSQARQNFRVSVTRAKTRTTILTPKGDPCVLLVPEG